MLKTIMLSTITAALELNGSVKQRKKQRKTGTAVLKFKVFGKLKQEQFCGNLKRRGL
jgi:hypothetical protein